MFVLWGIESEVRGERIGSGEVLYRSIVRIVGVGDGR